MSMNHNTPCAARQALKAFDWAGREEIAGEHCAACPFHYKYGGGGNYRYGCGYDTPAEIKHLKEVENEEEMSENEISAAIEYGVHPARFYAD